MKNLKETQTISFSEFIWGGGIQPSEDSQLPAWYPGKHMD